MPLGLPNHGNAISIADPSQTIASQVKLDPNGRDENIDHVSIVFIEAREFFAQFFQ